MLIAAASSPEDTPFEDGVFKLTLRFTEEYPNKAPLVKFVTRIFHPNGKAFGLTTRVSCINLSGCFLFHCIQLLLLCYRPGVQS